MLTNNNMKNYTEIKGYEGLYWINKSGIIKNNNNEIIQPWINADNYTLISLYKNRRKKTFYVHRLVALMYVKNPKKNELNEVDHLDKKRKNNYYYKTSLVLIEVEIN